MLFPVVRRVLAVTGALLVGAAFSSQAQVRINEIFADNKTNLFVDGSISDWVELFNPSAEAVNLASYSLTDSTTEPRKWVFPSGVSIAGNGYLVVLLDSGRPPSTVAGPVLNAGFGASASGDRVELYSPATQLIDSVRFGPQAANYTIGRVPSGAGNFLLTIPTPGAGNSEQQLESQTALKINEWMARPSSGDDWFELFNPGTLPVQLTGLHFTDTGNNPSPVAPLSFIGGGEDGYLQIFADNSTNDNEVSFGLGGGGDSINLFLGNTVIDQVQFGQQTQGVSQGRLPDGSSSIQTLGTPTPGDSNLTLYQGVVVNELLSHTDPPLEDAVEFYNQTDAPVNVGGWFLSNSRTDLKRFRLPDGTQIPARGYLVIYESQFNGPSATTPFTFSSEDGDQVYLAEAVNGQLTGRVVEEVFEAAENGVSFGRVETSVPGDHKFVAMSSRTFGVDNPTTVEEFRTGTGKVNSPPRVGPVVISEVMYNPVSLDGFTENVVEEFIELANITSVSVPLFDPLYPTNRWILQGGVSFTFPRDTSLPAGAVALVVSFDPAVDATQLASFRTKYAVPAGVGIFGPYSGKLGNGGDQVELYKPDPPQAPGTPDAGFVPYIRVDKVNYLDVAPWPTAADGTGMSLQRKNNATFGNDPINWEAANPTAGRVAGGSTGAPQITQITRAASGLVALEFTATAGQSYAVQTRDSLQPASPWQLLSSTNATGSVVRVEDAGAVGKSQRFYQVVTPAN